MGPLSSVRVVEFAGLGAEVIRIDRADAQGNTKEYAEYYAGNPQEYHQYMRLFNDMVSAVLGCDKPVICRVNGMRIGGGQEIGMACDFSITHDLAKFGQAGSKHGSGTLRKPKIDAWNNNKKNSRAWLALNMMTEARAGFRAFK